jgi:multidrug resistance efflux pump
MRLPRVRFTIRRLMAAVLVVGLLLGAVIAVQRGRVRRQVALNQALADHQNATFTRQVTQIAVTGYLQGGLMSDLVAMDREVEQAESELKRAKEQLARARRTVGMAMLSRPDIDASERAVQRANCSLEQTETKREVLLKKLKELESEVEKARADEQARKTTLDRVKWMVLY